jgi:hypothetical protein
MLNNYLNRDNMSEEKILPTEEIDIFHCMMQTIKEEFDEISKTKLSKFILIISNISVFNFMIFFTFIKLKFPVLIKFINFQRLVLHP